MAKQLFVDRRSGMHRLSYPLGNMDALSATITDDSHVSSDSDVTDRCVPATRGFSTMSMFDVLFSLIVLLVHPRVHDVRGVLTYSPVIDIHKQGASLPLS